MYRSTYLGNEGYLLKPITDRPNCLFHFKRVYNKYSEIRKDIFYSVVRRITNDVLHVLLSSLKRENNEK
jgi:hypothetical protein